MSNRSSPKKHACLGLSYIERKVKLLHSAVPGQKMKERS